MTSTDLRTLRGSARSADGTLSPATVTLGPDGFAITPEGASPVSAGYRDLTAIAAAGGSVTITLGSGALAERWSLEQFGQLAGALVKGLREGRLRQHLADGLVELDPGAEIDLVEYEAGAESGIAQLAYHDRGVILAPVDERGAMRRIRRADIGTVTLDPSVGGVAVTSAGASLAPVAGAPAGAPSLLLLRLGALARAHADRWSARRDRAVSDATGIVTGLVPDAGFGERRLAASLLLDGRPAAPADLGAAWAPLERAVLGVPPFDESYRVLRTIGGGDRAPRWLASAPERPGAPDSAKTWFFVGLPGNLVALELVSEGSHATYCFRVVPRARFTGTLTAGALEAAVTGISEALIDARFLREPMALPAARLAAPEALRYRLALTALPTLAAARARFVARIVHRDAAGWEAALRDLVAWHGSARDDTAEWPGRAAQESEVDDAATSGGS
ncbi:MAG: hypothetical protein WCK58_04875 [Chloroflexota bacterium]